MVCENAVKLRLSLAGRLALYSSLLLILVTAAGAALSARLEPWWLAWSTALLLALPLLWVGVHAIVVPLSATIRALTDGADSLRDSDFSVSIAHSGRDEIGALVDAQNALGKAMREERQTLYQRELLLDTVIQTTDIALLLINLNDRIVYSNVAARQLFNAGRPVNGCALSALLGKLPPAFAEAVDGQRSGLFTVEGDEPQTYHYSQERFTLNTQPQRLLLFKRLTRELGRQEVATWKKVIRVISHELNNSLAPISSLAHSGRLVLQKGDDTTPLDTILATIEDRSAHLKNFIASYARFARLPVPRPEVIDWSRFLEQVRNTVSFRLEAPLPSLDLEVDPVQFEQVFINLLKNAHESGSAPDAITVAIESRADSAVFMVSDAGGGVSDEVLKSALLPFYSTKKTGTGLGLPLCREIVEAHGGRLSLVNHPGEGLDVRIVLPRP